VIERTIMAGFGGQGMMLMGKVYAAAAMTEGKEVTFFPSYGAEVRGGTAHCHVIISADDIYAPIVEVADSLVIMNQPSYTKFRPRLKEGGLLMVNTSLTALDPAVEDGSSIRILAVPVTEIANELGNVRVANTIMLGACTALRPILRPEAVLSALEKTLTGVKAHLIDINRIAFSKGIELAAQVTM
jgi:2-oxoglutarate ferredoxin oxidoreductase subunit gamma